MQINSLAQGLQQTLAAFSERVERTQAFGLDPEINLAEEQVAQIALQRSAEAQIKAIQAEEEMLGLLFDELA